MPDLVEKYFNADLTEAEQEALSQALLESDEAALQFETMAQESYLSFGLPNPQPRWSDGPKGPSPSAAGLKPWFWVGLAAVGAAAFWGYHHRPAFFKKADPSSQAPQAASIARAKPGQASTGVAPGQGVDPAGKGYPINPKPETSLLGTSSAGKWNQPAPPVSGRSAAAHPGASPAPEADSGNTSLTTTSPVVAAAAPFHRQAPPVNLDQNPSKTFSGLSVQVGLAKPGPLKVRVLDDRGTEETVIYRGRLNPGNWVFEWDGQLSDGRHAPAGFYRIEVRSGTYTQSKKIQIQ